jgi:hypothetical protein
MVCLQFMHSRINRKLCLLKALCQFLIVGFDDGCFVQILPRIIVFHCRSSFGIEEPLDLANGGGYASKGKRIFGLASSRIEGDSSRSGSLRDVSSVFAKKHPPTRRRRKVEKSNTISLAEFAGLSAGYPTEWLLLYRLRE